MRNIYEFLRVNPKGKNHCGDLGCTYMGGKGKGKGEGKVLPSLM
jgi:hypothetical protein